MLYREIIAVCSQIHTKHINTLCGQNIELLNVKLVVHIVTTGPVRGYTESWQLVTQTVEKSLVVRAFHATGHRTPLGPPSFLMSRAPEAVGVALLRPSFWNFRLDYSWTLRHFLTACSRGIFNAVQFVVSLAAMNPLWWYWNSGDLITIHPQS